MTDEDAALCAHANASSVLKVKQIMFWWYYEQTQKHTNKGNTCIVIEIFDLTLAH